MGSVPKDDDEADDNNDVVVMVVVVKQNATIMLAYISLLRLFTDFILYI